MDTTALTDNPYDALDFAVWGTQAGGLARWSDADDAYVWHEVPDWAARYADGDPEKPVVGQPINPQLDRMPANTAAERQDGDPMLRAWR